MKYYLSSAKSNISEFLIVNENLIINNKTTQLILNDSVLFRSSYDFFVKNGVVFSNQESECLLYDLAKQTFKSVKNRSMVYFNSTNNNLLLFIDVVERTKLYLFDYQNNTDKILLQNYNWEFLYLTQQRLFIYDKSILKSLSLLTGEYEWEYQVIGEILSILGEYKGILLVCLRHNQQNFSILGIDILTGKKAWHLENNALLNGYQLQFQRNTIFTVKSARDNSYFIEINLDTQTPIRYGDLLSLSKNGIGGIKSAILVDKLIYFTAADKGFALAEIVGVMDYESLEVLWWQKIQLAEDCFLNQAPQVSENQLYVLDSGGTLHIFERENE